MGWLDGKKDEDKAFLLTESSRFKIKNLEKMINDSKTFMKAKFNVKCNCHKCFSQKHPEQEDRVSVYSL